MSVLALGIAAALGSGPAFSRAEPGPERQAGPPSELGPAAEVRLLDATDEEYLGLDLEETDRTIPESPMRLVVFQHGRPVLDLGLRNERGPDDLPVREETALVADDGSAAAIVETTHRTRSSTIKWLPAADLGRAWRLEIAPGGVLDSVFPLPAARGLVVSVARGGPDDPADLHVYGPDAHERFRIDALEARVADVRCTVHGGFLAADLSYRERPGLPDRAILVMDLLLGNSWRYSWSYGDDNEPKSWTLEETGVLAVETGSAVFRYDRLGKLLQRRRP